MRETLSYASARSLRGSVSAVPSELSLLVAELPVCLALLLAELSVEAALLGVDLPVVHRA
jgi:hypothetical protein